MNHYIKTTILDLGAFINSELTVRMGTQPNFFCCSCPFLGRIRQKRVGSETFILWCRPYRADFSLGPLFMVKLKTFENGSLSWICWQILTLRRASSNTVILGKLSLKHHSTSARGTELSNGRRWSANDRDLMCVSLGHTVAPWPSTLNQFFFSFLFFPTEKCLKGWGIPILAFICGYIAFFQQYLTGLLTTTHGGAGHCEKVSLNTKHQVFSAVYLYFFLCLFEYAPRVS